MEVNDKIGAIVIRQRISAFIFHPLASGFVLLGN
jgi:hypothetical protein